MNEELKVMVEMKKMFNMLKRYADKNIEQLQNNDLTPVQIMILGYISENSNRDLFQRDIETAFNIRRSTVTNVVQMIEKKGFIKRESVKNDARLKKIVLTDKSIKLGEIFIKMMDSLEEKIKVGITQEEFKSFFHVIEKINRNLEDK